MEEEAREKQKPKDYSAQEVEDYDKLADEVEQLLASLALRQKSGGADPEAGTPGSVEAGTPRDPE